MKKNNFFEMVKLFLLSIKEIFIALYNSLLHLYSRIALWCATRKVNLPGLKKIKSSLPIKALAEYERRTLIYQIKSERYSAYKGPIVFRKLSEGLRKFNQRNRVLLFIIFKISIGVLFIGIPVGLFFLLRGVLPVPDRIPIRDAAETLQIDPHFKTSFPYTESPFLSPEREKNTANFVDEKFFRGVSITSVLEPNSPPGLMHFGIGDYPQKVNLMRGFLVGESSPVVVKKQRDIHLYARQNNILNIKFYLFPSKDREKKVCQLQIFDEKKQILANSVHETPQGISEKQLGKIAKAWKLRFTPNYIADYGSIHEFSIAVDSLPKEIFITATQMSEENLSQEDIFPKIKKQFVDISDNDCIFAVSDFSLRHFSVTPQKRRGMIFVLVDTLREKTAYDKKLMPHLNSFAEKNSFVFHEHRAQANMTVPSVSSLLSSRYPRDLGSIAFAYASGDGVKKSFYGRNLPLLGTSLQQLGYRVGAIGNLSLFTEALEGGVDFGFHSAVLLENAEYEARQITEEALTWLENYGEYPFFLYLHYNTMHGPYKPPARHLSLLNLLKDPFSFHIKSELYNGLARYWDEEFSLLQKKLRQLGIENDIDIIVTADHGMQIEPQPFHYFSGIENNTIGSYADKGHTLFDEEIKVPFIFKIAQQENNSKNEFSSQHIEYPSAHIDILPTLYSFMGGNENHENWRGLNLNPALAKTSQKIMHQILQQRDTLYFDGHRYAGIVHWDRLMPLQAKKYIRQLNTDSVTLITNSFPFRAHIKWFQAEQFSQINFKDHQETWIPTLSFQDLKELREIYFAASPSAKFLQMTGFFQGDLNFTLKFKKDFRNKPKVEILPQGIKFKDKILGNSYLMSFNGNIEKDDKILVNLFSEDLEDISFASSVTVVSCPGAMHFSATKYLAESFNKNICWYFPVDQSVISDNYPESTKPILLQKSLANEEVQNVIGQGGGEALKNALKEWGYAR